MTDPTAALRLHAAFASRAIVAQNRNLHDVNAALFFETAADLDAVANFARRLEVNAAAAKTAALELYSAARALQRPEGDPQ